MMKTEAKLNWVEDRVGNKQEKQKVLPKLHKNKLLNKWEKNVNWGEQSQESVCF